MLFFLLSVVWGSGFVVVKIGQSYFPSVFYAALCFDVTAVGLFAYILTVHDQWHPRTRRGWFATGAIAFFTVVIYNSFFLSASVVHPAPSARSS
ncbi:EamA family transporter [Natronomonas sp.]|uniref:EamA family transporter n=1 Tax=Natronomonas sp. TaxID=2184060 RepID=UPI00286FE681|nr:EamA family transporter [Natronomonas sp.]